MSEGFSLGKRQSLKVFFAGEYFVGIHWPFNAQLWVVKSYRCFMGRSIDIIYLVGEDGLVAQHQKTMGKATGNKELPLVVLAQLYHNMLSECCRVLAQVNGHIQHASFDDPYQLGLRKLAFLVVEPSEHTFA